MLEAALEYHSRQMSVIPVSEKKTPLVSWLKYQNERASEDQIREWWRQYPSANIGIVTGEISGITVLDCDSQDAITAFRSFYKGDTPTAKTPRGTHYYFKYHPGTRNTVKIRGLDLDLRSSGGYVIAPPSINSDGLSYEWLKDLNIAFDLLDFDFLYKGGVDRSSTGVSSYVNNVNKRQQFYIQGRRDQDLFHLANCLLKGHAEPSFINQTLEIIANNCNPPYPEKDIQIKIESAIKFGKEKDRKLSAEVEEFVLSTTGNFLSTEVANCLHLSTRSELQNLSMIMKRLVEKGVAEKVGNRNGMWRRVDNDVQIIDWRNATGEEYPVSWPLGIERLVKLYPGNIAVIAGASNTGKTSFMIELIRLNEKKYGDKMLYANSEMAAAELRLRIDAYPEDMQKHATWNFKAIERSSNFADVIIPDGFNIIDFMEVYDEFWKIGAWIRDVHAKLTTGIAVIAIQKKATTEKQTNDFGRGGELTLEKPRLYLSMDRGIVKIIKGKIWRSQDRNPNGMTRRFKLVGGWKWMPDDAWKTEEEDQTVQKFSGYVEKKQVARKVDSFDDEVKREGGYI